MLNSSGDSSAAGARRRLVTVNRVLLLLLALLLVAASTVVLTGQPRALGWRAALLRYKLVGDLPDIPIVDLVRWLKPGSDVWLEPMRATRNPFASVRNGLAGPAAEERGQAIFRSICGTCHGLGSAAHAPDLLRPEALGNDWRFFSTVRWGRPGTGMVAQSISERQIWEVHAFLRARQKAAGSAAAARPFSVAVDAQQLVDAARTPEQWILPHGDYAGHRHSALGQITPVNVSSLRAAWVAQLRGAAYPLESSPIVVSGVMYVTETPDGVTALKADSGEVVWTYRRPVPDDVKLCCGIHNKGVAVRGDTVFVGTLDAKLVALDAVTGQQRWIVDVADHSDGFAITAAPLVIGDKIVIGVAGAEFGVRCYLSAYSAADGRLLWRTYTVPAPGEPGNETWQGDSWQRGGASTWTTGSYDPATDTLFWGTGNPGPDFNAKVRKGDNLYSNSLLALDASTGKLKWHFQHSPADELDRESTQVPILADLPQPGGGTKPFVLQANRNGFYYVLERGSGRFVSAVPYVKQTWAEGIDANGRPRMRPGAEASALGNTIWPGTTGGTNWWSPSYDAALGLVFVPAVEAASVYFRQENPKFRKGMGYIGGSSYHPETVQIGAFVRALEAGTGALRWQFDLARGHPKAPQRVGGVLSTASGVLFVGYHDTFYALEAKSGRELWRFRTGGIISAAPVTYAINGRQYVAVVADHSLFTFALN